MSRGLHHLSAASARALSALYVTREAGYRVPLAIVDTLSRYVGNDLARLLADAGRSPDDFNRAALACLGLAREGRADPEDVGILAAAAADLPRPAILLGLAHTAEALALAGDAAEARRFHDMYSPTDARELDYRSAKAWLSAALRLNFPDLRKTADFSAGLAQSIDVPQQGGIRLFWLQDDWDLIDSPPLTATKRYHDAAGNRVEPDTVSFGETCVVRVTLTGTVRAAAVRDMAPAGFRIIADSLTSAAFEADSASGMTINSKETMKEQVLVFVSLSGLGSFEYAIRKEPETMRHAANE